MRIAVQDLTKRFGPLEVVSRAGFSIEEGELFTLLGPSGCGKTTLLRLIAGFYAPDEGEIRFDDRKRQRGAAARARHRHGVPELRAVAAHDGVPERRLRPQAAQDRARAEIADRVKGVLEQGASSRASATAIPGSSRAGSSSAWRSRARWCSTPRSCCSTSRSPISTPRSGSRCGRRSASCRRSSASPRSTSRTTRRRRSRFPTGSRCSTRASVLPGRRAARALRAAGQPLRRRLHRHQQPDRRHGARGRRRGRPADRGDARSASSRRVAERGAARRRQVRASASGPRTSPSAAVAGERNRVQGARSPSPPTSATRCATTSTSGRASRSRPTSATRGTTSSCPTGSPVALSFPSPARWRSRPDDDDASCRAPRSPRSGSALIWAFLIVFVFYPLTRIFYDAFTNEAGQFTLANFLEFFTDSFYLRSLWKSLAARRGGGDHHLGRRHRGRVPADPLRVPVPERLLVPDDAADDPAAARRRARLRLHPRPRRHGERAAPGLVRARAPDQLHVRRARRAARRDGAPLPADDAEHPRRARQGRPFAGGGRAGHGRERLAPVPGRHAAAHHAGLHLRRAARLHLDLRRLRHAAGGRRAGPARPAGVPEHRAVRRPADLPHGHRDLGAARAARDLLRARRAPVRGDQGLQLALLLEGRAAPARSGQALARGRLPLAPAVHLVRPAGRRAARRRRARLVAHAVPGPLHARVLRAGEHARRRSSS